MGSSVLMVVAVVSVMLFQKVVSIPESCPAGCDCLDSDIVPGSFDIICNEKDIKDVPVKPSGITVDFLDLSNNDISTLKAHAFKSYENLQVLYLHFAGIDEIEDYAFDGLENIEEIDLSDNYLTEMTSKVFLNLRKLEIVSLSGNPLVDVDTNFPILESTSIKYLDLSYCKLLSVSEKTFSELPNLEKLDLNSNSMKHLKINYLLPLAHLKFVDLSNNPWACECELKEVLNWVSSRTSTAVPTETSVQLRKKRSIIGGDYQKPIQCLESGKFRKLWSESDKTKSCISTETTIGGIKASTTTTAKSSTVSREPRHEERHQPQINLKQFALVETTTKILEHSGSIDKKIAQPPSIPSSKEYTFFEKNMPTIYSVAIVILIFVFSVLGTFIAIRHIVPLISGKRQAEADRFYERNMVQPTDHGYKRLSKYPSSHFGSSSSSILRPSHLNEFPQVHHFEPKQEPIYEYVK